MRKNNDVACIGFIIFFVIVIGFSGLIEGWRRQLPVLSVTTIIIVIICLIVMIMDKADKKQERNRIDIKEEKQTQIINDISHDKQIGNIETSSIAYTIFKEVDKNEIYRIKNSYSGINIPTFSVINDPLSKEMESYKCKEIAWMTNAIDNKKKDSIERIIQIKRKLDELLFCQGCINDQERLDYLKAHSMVLQKLKNEYNDIYGKFGTDRIELLSKDKKSFFDFYRALKILSQSHKIVNQDGTAFSDFCKLDSSLPDGFFQTNNVPIELNLGGYHFFLLPDLVLVYNANNKYVAAFDPVILVVQLINKEKGVYKQKDYKQIWNYSDSIISDDSELIAEGTIMSRWYHSRADGGPDRRYSRNYIIETKVDKYSYTELNVQIGKFRIVFLLSRGNLAKQLKPLIAPYCTIAHDTNIVPSFLKLLEYTAKNREEVSTLSEEYFSLSKNTIAKRISSD